MFFIHEKEIKMVIIGMQSYPPESSKELANRFANIPPLPPYVTMKGPYFSSEIGGGVKTITIYEFDQAKGSEAIQAIYNRYAKYYGTPGFTYSINIWLDVKEALKTIGLA